MYTIGRQNYYELLLLSDCAFGRDSWNVHWEWTSRHVLNSFCSERVRDNPTSVLTLVCNAHSPSCSTDSYEQWEPVWSMRWQESSYLLEVNNVSAVLDSSHPGCVAIALRVQWQWQNGKTSSANSVMLWQKPLRQWQIVFKGVFGLLDERCNCGKLRSQFRLRFVL